MISKSEHTLLQRSRDKTTRGKERKGNERKGKKGQDRRGEEEEEDKDADSPRSAGAKTLSAIQGSGTSSARV